MISFQSMQHLRCPPFRRIHILVRAHMLVRAVKTTEICANATQSHTISLVPVLRVRKGRGLRASMLSDRLTPWTPKAVERNQVSYVDHQLHHRCSRWNVGYTPPLQPPSSISSLSFPEPIPMGARVPNWAYLDPTRAVGSSLGSLFQVNSNPSRLQSDGKWNASAAQLAGGT